MKETAGDYKQPVLRKGRRPNDLDPVHTCFMDARSYKLRQKHQTQTRNFT